MSAHVKREGSDDESPTDMTPSPTSNTQAQLRPTRAHDITNDDTSKDDAMQDDASKDDVTNDDSPIDDASKDDDDAR
ncbi:MAG: hypothetical protein L6R38_002943 [Xanthoria sp. 2 TBL-2021]|nr:MAG: hypothetical protein L6R38_002943 [Xanthoria sp. 2 TBL-2021]